MSCPKSMLLGERGRRRSRSPLQKRRKRRPRFVHIFRIQQNAKKLITFQEFYTEGTVDLLEARRSIAEYSLPRLDFRYTALSA